MSKIGKGHNGCICHATDELSGTMSLTAHARVNEHTGEALHAHKQLAQQLQNTHMQDLMQIHTKSYLGSHHAHPNITRHSRHVDIPSLLAGNDVSIRVSHTDNNDHTVCANVTRDALADALRDGTVSVKAPMNRGTFRLHSGKTHVITGIEFLPS